MPQHKAGNAGWAGTTSARGSQQLLDGVCWASPQEDMQTYHVHLSFAAEQYHDMHRDSESKAKYTRFFASRITLVHASALHAVFLRGSEDAVRVQPVFLSTGIHLLLQSSACYGQVSRELPDVVNELRIQHEDGLVQCPVVQVFAHKWDDGVGMLAHSQAMQGRGTGHVIVTHEAVLIGCLQACMRFRKRFSKQALKEGVS